jgi:hypothetical protein
MELKFLLIIFQKKVVKDLSDLLKLKFDLNNVIQFKGNNNQFLIYIKADSIPKLKQIILPHMYYSMIYKLGIKSSPTNLIFNK